MSCWEEMKGRKVSGKKKKKDKLHRVKARRNNRKSTATEEKINNTTLCGVKWMWRRCIFCLNQKQFTALHACLNNM